MKPEDVPVDVNSISSKWVSRSKHFLGAELVTAFLNPEVDEDDYMAMPGGIGMPAGGPWVCILHKSLTQAGPQTLV
jgi:hypothetical protein